MWRVCIEKKSHCGVNVQKSFHQVKMCKWHPANINVSRLVCSLLCAHTCLQFMAGQLKRELIKTKYVNLTILPLHPPRTVVESGSCLPCWKALRGNQKRMTEWKRPFKQWAQKTCKIEGRRMEEEERGVEAGRFQEGRAKQSDGKWKKEKAFKKKKKKRVLGEPVFQVTPDLDLL